MNTILLGLLLTLGAGLATGIGSALAFFSKRTNIKFLAGALGFSAGVMIYVSFVEILVKAREALQNTLSASGAELLLVGSFFAGILVIGIIDRLIPSFENPHEAYSPEEMKNKQKAQRFRQLHRMGLFTALAIAIHNFPEGLATFAATLADPSIGIAIAIAIAIHNIPEGIAVSIPVYYATGSRKKAFWLSFFSGLAEPLGALIGYFLLRNYFNDLVFGILFAAVAGIMVFISLDELIPSAQKFGHHHHYIYGLIAGMAVMATSLLLTL